MGVTEEGGTARGTPQERGESRNVEGGKPLEKRKGECEEGSKAILREIERANRGGKRVTWCREWRKKRNG